MKYGLALLDPSTQPFFEAQSKKTTLGYVDSSLSPAPNIPVAFADRPDAWQGDLAQKETEKYIILMTDGAVSHQYRPIDPEEPTLVDVSMIDDGIDNTSSKATSAENVTDLKAICDIANEPEKGVTVYTIAFDPPATRLAQIRSEMEYCATADSTYYEAYGDGIVRTFQSIARTINKLRLTN